MCTANKYMLRVFEENSVSRTKSCGVYTQSQFLTCSSFFPYSVKVTDMFFEILKEGTEKLSVMLNLFQHLCDKFLKAKLTDGECEKQEA